MLDMRPGVDRCFSQFVRSVSIAWLRVATLAPAKCLPGACPGGGFPLAKTVRQESPAS